jgi:hypothetical protein
MESLRFDPVRYVEEAAALLDLPLAADHKPGVVANMVRLAAMAELVMSFPLDEATEAAPVFRP